MEPIPTAGAASMNRDFVVVDARGHRCPIPTLKLRRKMEESQEANGFILWADDPMAQIDIPHFCIQNNYLLQSTDIVDEAWIFTIVRTGR